MSFFQLKVKNDTKIFDANKIYILAKGVDPNHDREGQYTYLESYLQFDAQGQGSFVVTKQGMPSTAHFAKLLSTFPQDDSGNYVLSIPQTTGGRLYLSLGKTITLTVTVGYNEQEQPVSLTLAEPDPYKKDDPSFAIIYDKIEYTYNDDGLWIDTTAVDFFAMPLTLKSQSSAEVVGLSQPRATVLDQLDTDLSGEWKKLKVEFAGSVLRVVAPNKAIGRSVDAENFNEDYLDTYIQAVWNYYQTHKIQIDCAEIIGQDSQVTAGHSLFTGSVLNDGITFRFENDQSYQVDIKLPTSNQVFGCDGGSMTAIAHKAQSVIVREIGAALNVGLLPLAGTPTLNKAYFTSHKGSFYQNSPQLPSKMQDTGPWYNLYARTLHSFGEKVYAFAYDDAVGEDSTLHTTTPTTDPITLTISDMTGTHLPDPDDPTVYSITLNLPSDATGTYDGHTLTPGANDFSNVKSPFTMTYNGTDYAINIRLGAATPPLVGLAVGSPDANNHVNIAFPA